ARRGGGPAPQHEVRAPAARTLHQSIQSAGVSWMQTDAAVRRGTAEPADLVAAVNGVSAMEENGMGHRRVVVLLREPAPGQPLRPVATVRRGVAGAAGRNSKAIARHAVDQDGHLLSALVDR